jgi:hypothetical protein
VFGFASFALWTWKCAKAHRTVEQVVFSAVRFSVAAIKRVVRANRPPVFVIVNPLAGIAFDQHSASAHFSASIARSGERRFSQKEFQWL